mgnify:CR=1 FL=1
MAAGRAKHARVERPVEGQQQRPQHNRNGQIDGGPANRDPKLLHRLGRDALQPREAADGVERNAARADPEAARREGVPELMEHHAHEDGQDEPHARSRLRDALALDVVKRPDGHHEQEKGPVQEDANPGNGPNSE